MRNRGIALATGLVCLTGCIMLWPQKPRISTEQWVVYYDTKTPAEKFRDYDLVVFDRRHYPDFVSLKGKSTVLAYISIGEVYDDVPERIVLAEKNLILEKNRHWASHSVDITAPIWRAMVLSDIDDAVAKGFDGVMLDTIDSPLAWAETKAPERLPAMRQAAIDLIESIRKAHPQLKIMVNRGFSILPAVANDIDFILAESILVNTNVSTGQFSFFSGTTYGQVAAQLHQVRALAPHVKVFTLDYWNQDDVKGLETIYAAQRAQGFIPYVATPDLRRFTPEPRT